MRTAFVAAAAVAGIAAAGACAAPYWMGRQAEKHYYDQVHTAAAQYGLEVDHIAYDRGWLSSHAETTLRLSPAGMKTAPLTLTLVSDIHHGPVIFGDRGGPRLAAASVVSSVRLPPDLEKAVQFYVHSGALFTVSTRMDFGGGMVTHLEAPAYDGPSRDGSMSVNWKGLSGDGAVTPAGDITFFLKAPGLTVRDRSGAMLELGSLRLSQHGRLSGAGVMLGAVDASIARLRISPPDGMGAPVVLTGLKVTGNSTDHGGLLESRTEGRLAAVSAAGQRYGQARLDTAVHNIRASALAHLAKVMRDLPAPQPKQLDPKTAAMLQARLLPVVHELLEASPSFEISRASLDTPYGEAATRLTVRFDGSGAFNMMDVPALLNRLHIEAGAHMPDILVRTMLIPPAKMRLAAMLTKHGQVVPDDPLFSAEALTVVEQQLDGLVNQGFIVHRDGRYEAQLVYDHGVLAVNGHAMGLPLQLQ